MAYNNGNGYGYNNGGYAPQGQPQQAPQQQMPAQNQGYAPQGQGPQYAAPPQGGYPQPAHPQNQSYPAAPNAGYGQPAQNAGYPQQGNGKEKVPYSQYIINIPENAMALEHCSMTIALNSIKKELNLYIEQLTSKNNNPLVKFSFDLTIGDTDCARLFGRDVVNPDHKIRIEALMAGYHAENFLKAVPQCTKTIILMINNMKLGSFNRRDGSSQPKVDAFVVGYFVDHNSSKYKSSDIKAANLQEAKPYHVNIRKAKDSGNGAPSQSPYPQQAAPYGAPAQGGYQQPAPPQGGYPQQAPAQNNGYAPQGQPQQASQYGAPQPNGYGYGYAAQQPAQNPLPGTTQYGGNGGELPF